MMSEENLPTVEEIVEATGVSKKAAYQRLFRVRIGLSRPESLLAPKGVKPSTYRRKVEERVEKLMQRVPGLTRDAARRRLGRYDEGALSGWRLFDPVAPHNMVRDHLSKGRLDRLSRIPGPTEWERRNIGI